MLQMMICKAISDNILKLNYVQVQHFDKYRFDSCFESVLHKQTQTALAILVCGLHKWMFHQVRHTHALSHAKPIKCVKNSFNIFWNCKSLTRTQNVKSWFEYTLRSTGWRRLCSTSALDLSNYTEFQIISSSCMFLGLCSMQHQLTARCNESKLWDAEIEWTKYDVLDVECNGIASMWRTESWPTRKQPLSKWKLPKKNGYKHGCGSWMAISCSSYGWVCVWCVLLALGHAREMLVRAQRANETK